MSNEIELSQAQAMANPEAAIDAMRDAFVRGESNAVRTALGIAIVAMMAFAMRRRQATEDAEALTQALLEKTAGDEEAGVFVAWAVHVCAAVADTLRSTSAHLACQFELTAALAQSTAGHIQAAGTAWQRMLEIEPGLAQNRELAFAVGALNRLPLLARMTDAQARAQRQLLLGNRQQYVESLQQVLAIVEDERRMPVPLEDTFAPVIRQNLAEVADGVRAQLDYVGRSLATTDLSRLEPSGRKVFIVHGHDEGAWRAVKDMLEDEFGLQTVVLKEEASHTRTLIQKFEAEAADCAFAIVLVTPDDLVKKGKTVTLQARPNVLFELGWFYGRLGPGRVTLVQKGEGTALPSDLKGIVTLVYAQDMDEIQAKLRKELVAAGLVADKAAAKGGRRSAATKARRA